MPSNVVLQNHFDSLDVLNLFLALYVRSKCAVLTENGIARRIEVYTDQYKTQDRYTRFGSVQGNTMRGAVGIQKAQFGASKHKVWSCGYNPRLGGRKAGGDMTSSTAQARSALHHKEVSATSTKKEGSSDVRVGRKTLNSIWRR
jgi:hypothetical protein